MKELQPSFASEPVFNTLIASHEMRLTNGNGNGNGLL